MLIRFARVRISLLAGLLAWTAFSCAAAQPDKELSPDGVPQRLVLAIDGVPYGLFAELQQQGHFAAFRPVARMVAPFPSLSDVSFAAIGGNTPPAGYQVMRFDPISNRVVGNNLRSLSSQAHGNLPADSDPHSSWHRMIGYVAPYHVALQDLDQIGDELLESHKASFVGYLDQSDALLHVEGREGAIRFLLKLDRFLAGLQAAVRARTGRELLIDIVSDHGSTLVKGRNVRLDRQLRSCGFRRRSRIDNDSDVAYSLAGIIGSVAINARPGRLEDVGHCLAGADGVDLVAITRGDRVAILTGSGEEAELWPTPGASEAYSYRNLRGDPLDLLGADVASGTRSFAEAELFARTADAPYPDPLRRLWRAFHGAVQQPTPILVSLSDGREAAFRTVRALAAVRGRAGTHGSISRAASLGVFTSNWRDVADTDCWRVNEALFGQATHAALAQRADTWPTANTPVTNRQSPPTPAHGHSGGPTAGARGR